MVGQFETREVQVQQVNGHGFKSTAGDWLNVSKFAKSTDVVMPSVGDHVEVHLDKAGFVRRVEPVAPPATPAPASVAGQPIAFQNAPEPRMGPLAGHTTPEPSTGPAIEQDAKGTVILRMNVMTTATAILSSGGRPVNPDEVLALAARLEVWAIR